MLENASDKNASIKINSMDVFEKIHGIIDEKPRIKFIGEITNEASNPDWTIRLHVAKTLGEVENYIPLNMKDKNNKK